MKIRFQPSTRTLFVASVVCLILSLIFSVINVATVLGAPGSAPLRTVSAPSQIGFEGFLGDANGNPVVDGTYPMTFKLWDAASGGTMQGTAQAMSVPVNHGVYAAAIPSFGSTVFTSSSSRWIGVTVTGFNGNNEISPRTQVVSVPYALVAGAVDWANVQNRPTGYLYVPETTPINLTDGTVTWNGASSRAASGTPYTFDLSTAANGSLPSNVKAVVLLMSGNWSSASTSYSAAARPQGATINQMIIRAAAANISADNTGIVNVNTSNGDIEVLVSGAQINSCVIRLLGYYY